MSIKLINDFAVRYIRACKTENRDIDDKKLFEFAWAMNCNHSIGEADEVYSAILDLWDKVD